MKRVFAIAAAIAALAVSFPASAAPTGDEAAVRAVIARGYGVYMGTGQDSFVQLLSPDFDHAWKRALGKDGVLDFDPFCRCQDFDGEKFRYRITSLAVDGARAVAKVDVDIGFPPAPGVSPWQPFRMNFLKAPKGWRLDDINDETGASMKSAMATAKPGSWSM